MKKNIASIFSFLGEGLGVGLLFLLTACGGASVPTQYSDSKQLPQIYPDYAEVTIPVNIAPLSMELMQDAEDAVTRYSFGEDEIVCGGKKAMPDIADWKELTAKAKGNAIQVEVFAQNQGQWTRFKPFNIYVSPDSIDPYISYRLISPSYVTYEELTINQRSLEDYWEAPIYDNMLCGDEISGQCINCHNYQMYDPQRMQFHARQKNGGTVVMYDGNIKKVNMVNDSILSAGVYPSWHPWLKLIAYSTNKTMQSFHTNDINKIEVLDSESDLIVYDVEHNEVMNIENDPHEFEVYPFWAPDGKYLYYCSAHFEYEADTVNTSETIARAQEIKYSLYRKAFNPDTREFGPREMVFDAAAMDKSVTLPRISPDGRWLLLSLGGWGCFHIWHRDADLWLMDLQGEQEVKGVKEVREVREVKGVKEVREVKDITMGKDDGQWSSVTCLFPIRPLTECNSDNVESYHTWSSNGKWIIFSSRRDDGVYTRPFIAHMENGKGTKPFELPTEDPDYHRQLMKSYNIPEFMKGRVNFTPQQIADVLKQDVDPVEYVEKLK